MPFPDEVAPVVLVSSRDDWPIEFVSLASALRGLNLANFGAIEHVGSTSVPGLVAKDVIDVQIRIPRLEPERTIAKFAEAGFRHRAEPWNNLEATRTGPVPKLVFAPPSGARRSNVHVRIDGTKGASDALLFRDFLNEDDEARDGWSRFKLSLVDDGREIDLSTYGQLKQPAWAQLMHSAATWAGERNWRPSVLSAWSLLDFALGR
ncbi:MAG: GrpB family protein [Acidimicrobiales bacterium]